MRLFLLAILALSLQVFPQEARPDVPSSDDDLSLYEVGGMYFGMPYAKGTAEVDVNFWYEDESPGISLYGSYAFTDHLTFKLEVPAQFEQPIVSGFKATGIFGILNDAGSFSLSADLSGECYFGDKWQDIIPTLGLNIASRHGIFAVLGRMSGGCDLYFESGSGSYEAIASAECGPFVYTKDFGMVGVPVIYDWSSDGPALNIGLDWELYLPANFSFSIVPRVNVLDNGKFSIWGSFAWMYAPE